MKLHQWAQPKFQLGNWCSTRPPVALPMSQSECLIYKHAQASTLASTSWHQDPGKQKCSPPSEVWKPQGQGKRMTQCVRTWGWARLEVAPRGPMCSTYRDTSPFGPALGLCRGPRAWELGEGGSTISTVFKKAPQTQASTVGMHGPIWPSVNFF